MQVNECLKLHSKDKVTNIQENVLNNINLLKKLGKPLLFLVL